LETERYIDSEDRLGMERYIDSEDRLEMERYIDSEDSFPEIIFRR
jgi:hypothetical protein